MRLSDASEGFGGYALAGWIGTAWCRDQDSSRALKGLPQVIPGQSEAAQPRSVTPGWRCAGPLKI